MGAALAQATASAATSSKHPSGGPAADVKQTLTAPKSQGKKGRKTGVR